MSEQRYRADDQQEPSRFGSAGWDTAADDDQTDETVEPRSTPEPDVPKPDPDKDQG